MERGRDFHSAASPLENSLNFCVCAYFLICIFVRFKNLPVCIFDPSVWLHQRFTLYQFLPVFSLWLFQQFCFVFFPVSLGLDVRLKGNNKSENRGLSAFTSLTQHILTSAVQKADTQRLLALLLCSPPLFLTVFSSFWFWNNKKTTQLKTFSNDVFRDLSSQLMHLENSSLTS